MRRRIVGGLTVLALSVGISSPAMARPPEPSKSRMHQKCGKKKTKRARQNCRGKARQH